jgi:sec-independent protein translocase protein TatA
MGFGSPIHWIVLLLVVMLLFGGGRISSMMGDVAKGIKNFKKGLSDDEETVPPPAAPPARLDSKSTQTVDQSTPSATPAARDDHKQDG